MPPSPGLPHRGWAEPRRSQRGSGSSLIVRWQDPRCQAWVFAPVHRRAFPPCGPRRLQFSHQFSTTGVFPMADYFTPTVIHPPILASDITPLERLSLSQIFTAQPIGEVLYFYAGECPSFGATLSHTELAAALAASEAVTSSLNAYVAERLPSFP